MITLTRDGIPFQLIDQLRYELVGYWFEFEGERGIFRIEIMNPDLKQATSEASEHGQPIFVGQLGARRPKRISCTWGPVHAFHSVNHVPISPNDN